MAAAVRARYVVANDLNSLVGWLNLGQGSGAIKFGGVAESSVDYTLAIDYDYDHRDAEHEHEREPEPSRAPKDGFRGFTNGKSIARPR